MANTPNILWIITDQQRADMRAVVRKTPHLCVHLVEPYLDWVATEQGLDDRRLFTLAAETIHVTDHQAKRSV